MADLNSYDNTINKNNLITNYVTLKEGTYLANSVLGRVTGDGEYNLSLSTASDGSETPRVVLLEDRTIASGSTESVPVMVGGMVDIPSNLVLGASHTLASIKDRLRELGINLRGEV